MTGPRRHTVAVAYAVCLAVDDCCPRIFEACRCDRVGLFVAVDKAFRGVRAVSAAPVLARAAGDVFVRDAQIPLGSRPAFVGALIVRPAHHRVAVGAPRLVVIAAAVVVMHLFIVLAAHVGVVPRVVDFGGRGRGGGGWVGLQVCTVDFDGLGKEVLHGRDGCVVRAYVSLAGGRMVTLAPSSSSFVTYRICRGSSGLASSEPRSVMSHRNRTRNNRSRSCFLCRRTWRHRTQSSTCNSGRSILSGQNKCRRTRLVGPTQRSSRGPAKRLATRGPSPAGERKKKARGIKDRAKFVVARAKLFQNSNSSKYSTK